MDELLQRVIDRAVEIWGANELNSDTEAMDDDYALAEAIEEFTATDDAALELFTAIHRAGLFEKAECYIEGDGATVKEFLRSSLLGEICAKLAELLVRPHLANYDDEVARREGLAEHRRTTTRT